MKIAIIGGSGQMGEWFAIFFKQQGNDVIITGRNKAKAARVASEMGVLAANSNKEAIEGADMIVISVMPDVFEKVVKEIAPYITAAQKVIDITSVKVSPVMIMHKYIKKGTILGTHPMFGPTADKEGQNVVLTPTNAQETSFAREMSEMLSQEGFNVVITTPEKHDEMIAMMLSLTHFVGFVTADTWEKLGVDEHLATSSTSFRKLKDFVKSVLDSSPELYSYLQMNVENTTEIEQIFIDKATEWKKMIKAKERPKFAKKMQKLNEYMKKMGSD